MTSCALLPSYVLLDLETTGGDARRDRVTEIAAVRVDNGVETCRWSTLVNPGVPISAFIEKLTGISTALVADAPPFEAIGRKLLDLLEGTVLVAHNVRFDHSFLLSEFDRMGIKLRTRTLCTVRLSRRLYPQFKSHGLDAIMQRHDIDCKNRHRAMGDVEVMQRWLALASEAFGQEVLQQHCLNLLQASAALPPHLETHVADIAASTGVYAFYGEGALPLYIGKSVNMRSRVMAHFQAASRNPREMRMAQEIRRVECEPTAGELGALLLESRWVKERQPVYNRQLRRTRSLCTWQLNARPDARPLLTLTQIADLDVAHLDQFYGPYRSRSQALSQLRELADDHKLCLKALGLESGKGPCFAQQIGRCQGLCCDAESPERHYLRLQVALRAQQLRRWPFAGPVGLREHDPVRGLTDIHVFDRWCHLATVRSETELHEALATRNSALAFDLDTYRLALKHLLQPVSGTQIVNLYPR